MTDCDLVFEMIVSRPGVTASEVAGKLGISSVRAGDAVHLLREGGKVVGIGGLWFESGELDRLAEVWVEALKARHRLWPRDLWVPASEVIPLKGKPLEKAAEFLERAGHARRSGLMVAWAKFRPELPPKQQMLLDRVEEAVRKASPRFTHSHRLSLDLRLPEQAVRRALQLGVETGLLMALGERVVSRSAETTLMITSQLNLPEAFSLTEFMVATSLNRAEATTHLDAWDRLGVTQRGADTRTFSQKFQKALEDVRLANEDGAD